MTKKSKEGNHAPNSKPPFVPTPEMVQAAVTVLKAAAHEQVVRPIVETYQRKILAEREWRVRDEFAAGVTGPESRIGDIDDTYLMNDSDIDAFDRRCRQERDKAQLYVESDDRCPLLAASNVLVQAENALIDIMAPLTSLTSKRVTTREMRKKVVDLNLRLIVPHLPKFLHPDFLRAEAYVDVMRPRINAALATFWSKYCELYPEVKHGDSQLTGEDKWAMARWIAESTGSDIEIKSTLEMGAPLLHGVPTTRFAATVDECIGAVQAAHGLANPSDYVREQFVAILAEVLHWNYPKKR